MDNKIEIIDSPRSENDDEHLPPHLRRHGRIQSLHEFQRRVENETGQEVPKPESLYRSQSAAYHEYHYGIDIQPENGGESRKQSLNHSHAELIQNAHCSPPSRPVRKHFFSYDGSGDRISSPKGDDSESMYASFLDSHRKVIFPKSFQHKKIGRNCRLVVFLLLLGLIAGPLNYALKKLVYLLLDLKFKAVEMIDDFLLGYFVWTLMTVVLVFLACLWTKISPAAQGSGLPQVKTALTGIDPELYVPGFFTKTTFVAKAGGLVLALTSGLVLGTEGSFVHMMTIIAHRLLSWQFFSDLADRKATRLQLLAAATAVGVSSNFSSPVGGVLFSIEVTSTYYMISNYLKAFASSATAALAVLLTKFAVEGGLYEYDTVPYETTFPSNPYKIWEVPLFLLLGVCCGVLGGVVVLGVKHVAMWRKYSFAHPWFNCCSKYIDPVVVSIAMATVTWIPGEITRLPMSSVVEDLFGAEHLPERWSESVSLEYSLLIFAAIPIVMLPFCISMRLPTGAWLPMFAAGAGLGRAMGELMAHLYPNSDIIPGGYAIVGAACLAGATTRTVSAAVIVLEVTGQLRYIIPVLMSVILAIATAEMFSLSIYDTLAVVRKLPYLPLLEFTDKSKQVAGDVMDKNMVHIAQKTNIVKLLLAVTRLPGHNIPVIFTRESGLLLGTVNAEDLKVLIRMYYRKHKISGLVEDLVENRTIGTSSTEASSTWVTIKSMFSSTAPGNNRSFDLLHFMGGQSRSHGDEDFEMEKFIMQQWNDEKREVLQEEIDITDGPACCTIKPMPMTISSRTPLEDVHVIFTMLRCDHCYVTDNGKLCGVITTRSLIEAGNGEK